jgi:hypothetical protein
MKNLFTRTVTLLGLMVVGLAMTAAAQSSAVIKANIPFDFNFAGRTFPAGEYSIVQPIQHVLALRDSRKQTIAQTFTGGIESITPAEDTKLKFYSRDGQYYLSEVWQAQDSAGELLYQKKFQVDYAKSRSTDATDTATGSQP